MPVLSVRRGRSAHWPCNMDQSIRSSRVVEVDGVGAEVNAVDYVVPRGRVKDSAPLRHTTHIPLESVVRGAAGARNETILQLGEVRLEESDLVLLGRVRLGTFDGEVVVHFALVDRSTSLRN
jgi:hypothetical protein